MTSEPETRRSGHPIRTTVSRIADKRVARFLVIGAGAAVLELAAFQALVTAHLLPAVASLVSFAIGMTSSFLGYRNWTFAGDQTLPMHSQFGAYLTLAVVNAGISAALVQLMVSRGLHAWTAKVVMMAAVACWNFLILDRLVFRRRGRVAAPTSAGGSTEA